jgi:hypothetical protein
MELRKMKWKDKLTKKEKKHLSENKIRTKYDLEKQRDFLKKWIEEHKNSNCPCYECKHILIKLNMWND